MNRNEALEIIKEEKFKHYNWFGDHGKKPYEVSILDEDGKYKVYATNERAGIQGRRGVFTDESQALESFMKRLRAINKIYNKWGGMC